jgi:hypothetical protein
MTKRLLVSTFAHEQDILAATTAARENGYSIIDVYTPYAVHGLDKAMGLRPSRLPWICFGLGITGAIAKLWYQIWTSATSWPVNVGGKPLKSVPAFVPVTFEIMVLFAGVGTVLAFFFISRLRPGKRPKVNYQGVSDDRFVLVLEETDARFDVPSLRAMFTPFHVVSMEERVSEENTSPGSGYR